jgi:hypothetical protein
MKSQSRGIIVALLVALLYSFAGMGFYFHAANFGPS